MERTVIEVNAKNKTEAMIALEMLAKVIKNYEEDYDGEVNERVVVTNEGIQAGS